MPKYSCYLVNLDEGTVAGTNDVDEVQSFLEKDNYLVLFPNSGDQAVYFMGSTLPNNVEPLESPEESDHNEDEEDRDQTIMQFHKSKELEITNLQLFPLMARMYSSSWTQLRDSPTQELKIAAHWKLHPRIFKAICKEKNMDSVFKLKLSENCQIARLTKKSLRSGILTITMELSIGLEDL